MTRLLVLLTLMFGILNSQIANAIEVRFSPASWADITYVEVPKAEADWLVYWAPRRSVAGESLVLWYETDGIGCTAWKIQAVPKAQAKVKVHFVKFPSFARCKRKCDLTP